MQILFIHIGSRRLGKFLSLDYSVNKFSIHPNMKCQLSSTQALSLTSGEVNLVLDFARSILYLISGIEMYTLNTYLQIYLVLL